MSARASQPSPASAISIASPADDGAAGLDTAGESAWAAKRRGAAKPDAGEPAPLLPAPWLSGPLLSGPLLSAPWLSGPTSGANH
jgi:hypothetical protein